MSMRRARLLSFERVRYLSNKDYSLRKDGVRAGVRAAADFVKSFDRQLAGCVGGKRFSDIILGKFNERDGKPRTVRP